MSGVRLFLIDITINVEWNYSPVDSKEGLKVDKFFNCNLLSCNYGMIFTEKFSNESMGLVFTQRQFADSLSLQVAVILTYIS